MATHSSVLAWRIPGTGEPGGLPSMGSHRVGHDWSNLAVVAAYQVRSSEYGSIAFTVSGVQRVLNSNGNKINANKLYTLYKNLELQRK